MQTKIFDYDSTIQYSFCTSVAIRFRRNHLQPTIMTKKIIMTKNKTTKIYNNSYKSKISNFISHIVKNIIIGFRLFALYIYKNENRISEKKPKKMFVFFYIKKLKTQNSKKPERLFVVSTHLRLKPTFSKLNKKEHDFFKVNEQI